MDATQDHDHNQENILLNFFCFRNILETAVRYWKLAFICAILGVVVAFIATQWFIKPIYVAQSTIYSGKEKSDGSSDSMNSAYRELTVAMMLMNDYKAILDSNSVRNELYKRVCERFPDLKNRRYSVSIDIRRDSRVLTITASAGVPELAQFVAKETVDIFSAKVSKILKMDNVQTIDEANLPMRPSNLLRKRNLTIGFFIGLVIGIGLALLRGFIDQTIKNPEQAKRYLNVPVMGVVPKCDMPESRSNLIQNILDGGGSQELTEAYRLLRTNLQYFVSTRADLDGDGRVFMFTSSIPHEGKSSSISLVAALTARAGKKVLLIDADMHKPVIARIFNLRGSHGLVSVLTGEKRPDEVTFPIEDNLFVMPCGPVPPNPSELLMSERMPELLSKLRKQYDYIFIDITPALFLSDPLIVEPMVDGVLFLVSCSHAKIGLIQRTLRQLQQVTNKPIGMVVNKFDRGEVGNRYGYYGYYRYHSYYRYYRDYAHEPETDGKIVAKDEKDADAADTAAAGKSAAK